MFRERLIQTLNVELDKLKGAGIVGLAKEIAKANNDDEDRCINRAKLTRILSGDPTVTLHFGELHGLETYLATLNIRIGDLFDKVDLIRDLSRSKEVHYLLGAKKPLKRTHFVSQWDIQSMADLLRHIDRSRIEGLNHEIVDVLLRKSADFVGAPLNVIKRESWYSLLDPRAAPNSLVAIGSPRANHATEAILSVLFGRVPFCAYAPAVKPALPFHFSWNNETYTDVPSNFCVTNTAPDAMPTLFVGNAPHAVEVPKDVHDEFGVIAAQRRPNGQIWLVIAGLSGIATLAGAKMVPQFSIEPPLCREGEPPLVAWASVRAQVRVWNMGLPNETRVLLGQDFLTDPVIWPHESPKLR